MGLQMGCRGSMNQMECVHAIGKALFGKHILHYRYTRISRSQQHLTACTKLQVNTEGYSQMDKLFTGTWDGWGYR